MHLFSWVFSQLLQTENKTNTTANIGVYSAHIKRFILKIITGKQSK